MSKKKTLRFFVGKSDDEREIKPTKFVGLSSSYIATECSKRDARGNELEVGLLLDDNNEPMPWRSAKKIAKGRIA